MNKMLIVFGEMLRRNNDCVWLYGAHTMDLWWDARQVDTAGMETKTKQEGH